MASTVARRAANRKTGRGLVKRQASGFTIEEIAAPSQSRPSVHLVRRQGPHTYRHLFVADVHCDHKNFDEALFHRDMSAAVQADGTISIHGDLFDVMQSKDDPRGSLGGLIDKVDGVNYLDRCVKLAVELLAPYAPHIVLISDGNHETNILKRKHTDLIERVCEALKPHGFAGYHGWYQGWLVLQQVRTSEYTAPAHDSHRYSLKVYYHHGAGGAAKRSRGVLGLMNLADQAEGADLIVSGHLHMGALAPLHRHTLDSKYNPKTRTILMGRTGCYKDDSGSGGWGVEKGFGPPTLGGLWLDWSVSDAGDGSRMRAQLVPTESTLLR